MPPMQFSSEFDHLIRRPGHGDAAFGRNVLDALVAPLRDAAALPRTARNWGPGVLGCAMWMDDPVLLDVLSRMANCCVVITKQASRTYGHDGFARVENLARRSGLAQAAYPELSELAPRVDGRARAVGPYGGVGDGSSIGGVRELGFRRSGDHLVPIMHAKMLLLGSMVWSDEHPSGHVGDYLAFVPHQLWVGSANFTTSSRASLEMGMWSTDVELLSAARGWILRLIAMSEPLRPVSDDADPELLPVEFDHDAFAEYLRDQTLPDESSA